MCRSRKSVGSGSPNPAFQLFSRTLEVGNGIESPTFLVSNPNPNPPPSFSAPLIPQISQTSLQLKDLLTELQSKFDGSYTEAVRQNEELNLVSCPHG